ncbi:hypothetical protein [Geodermatophilus sp. DSM 44513]|uniref:hypothetical protein n=1 Tax=Geodermatophilus sp. DSM 44513 TaxID=1528104 RepID=UPI00126E5F63|nr:hypothetical protein [Geodermatophilus sp. DSM 44513]WNV75178.1 hypothetical protein RTG05_19650 [Geodermatophilus sp. DSM 44513]
MTEGEGRSSLRHFDVAAVEAQARAESRNRERVVPLVSLYRWWARRTDAVTGALLDAYAVDHPGRLHVADPFAGGGATALAALRRGHRVYAQDINPWAAGGLRLLLGMPSPREVDVAIHELSRKAPALLADAYATHLSDGTAAQLAHTLRVAVTSCAECGHEQKLFPHALVSLTVRRDCGGDHKPAWLACRRGHLWRADDATHSWPCPTCRELVDPAAGYTAGRRVSCTGCGSERTLAERLSTGARWEPVLVERVAGRRRELGPPTDREKTQAADDSWTPGRTLGAVPADGVETRVLHVHGFRQWEDLYPARQRVLLERLLNAAASSGRPGPGRDAVVLAVTGATEMAGLVSRWDRYYLKSYEGMAGHRFSLTTLAAEPHVWGAGSGRGTIQRRLAALSRSARWWAESPRQPQRHRGRRPTVVCADSRVMDLPDRSVDLVLTDPPYHDDVQYGELSLPLRAWAGLSLQSLDGETVAGVGDPGQYRRLLTEVLREAARVLTRDGHLVLTYANRSPAAWIDCLAALQAAGFRTVGALTVHAENETDAAKRGRRACSRDLVLDLVADAGRRRGPAERLPAWAPPSLLTPGDDERGFLAAVAVHALRVGALEEGWEEDAARTLSSHPFARPAAGSDVDVPLVGDPSWTRSAPA